MKYLILSLLLMTTMSLLAQKPVSKRMKAHFTEIESLIPYRDSLNASVSKADVAWHLYHSLKVVTSIYGALEASDPDAYRYQWSFIRGAVFMWGDFPRGIAQSPSAVRPPETIKTKDIYTLLAEARGKMTQYAALPKDSYFAHSSFKNLNRNRTIRFLEVHTKHHLKIIRDILQEK